MISIADGPQDGIRDGRGKKLSSRVGREISECGEKALRKVVCLVEVDVERRKEAVQSDAGCLRSHGDESQGG